MRRRLRHSTAGFSLLETIFALGILAVVALGVLPLGLIAVKTTENQGHLGARTTEYAQDKIEQLQVLAFGDTTSNTTVFPATDAGGTGLAVGGSADPGGPVASYVDYLDERGNLLGSAGGAPANWFYMRAWEITSPNANLKQIKVTAIVRAAAAGGLGRLPQSTLTLLKSNPF